MKGNQEISFELIVRTSPLLDDERLDLLCTCDDLQAECDCDNETISQALDAAGVLIELARDLVAFGSQLLERNDFVRDLDDLCEQAADSARTLVELAKVLIRHD